MGVACGVADHGHNHNNQGGGDDCGAVFGRWLLGKTMRIATECQQGLSGFDSCGVAHGLGAEVLCHLRLHVPSLEQGHGQNAKLFNISAALNGPGLGFQLKLTGKGGLKQR